MNYSLLPTRLGAAVRAGAGSTAVMWRRPAMALLLCATLAACASPPVGDPVALAQFESTNDPLEPFNRFMFDLNQRADRNVFRPVAKGYKFLVPRAARDAIKGVLDNANEPVNLANALLQGDFSRAGTVLGRVTINTVLGIGGIVDVAARDFGLHPVAEDFGQTLAVWGVGEGAYLVLPVVGPTTIRDGTGRGVDTFLTPLWYVYTHYDVEYVGLITTFVSGIDLRARNLEALDEIERQSVDFYAIIRSAYRQRREDQIHNGMTPETDPFLNEIDYNG